MALSTAPPQRLPGPDVTRALAMFGVALMNYHGFQIIDGAPRTGSDVLAFFDPWTGPFATRFAATFVFTAGVGVSLLTSRKYDCTTPDGVRAARSLLVRRGLVIFAFGLVFEMLWPGNILPYYGAMFAIAGVLFAWRGWVLGVIAVLCTFSAWAVERWAEHARGLGEPHPLSDLSFPLNEVADLFVFGTHPLLPWLTFFIAGLLVGRRAGGVARWGVLFVVGVACVVVAAATGAPTDPYSRGAAYTLSALGSAVAAYAVVSVVVQRGVDSAVVRAFQRAGRASLTVYIGHGLFFTIVVDVFGLSSPGTLATAVWLSVVYCVGATAVASWVVGRYGIGPAEYVYRLLTTPRQPSDRG